MGPRKQAKDSRKVCERGVPGNFYLARHSYIYIYIYLIILSWSFKVLHMSSGLFVDHYFSSHRKKERGGPATHKMVDIIISSDLQLEFQSEIRGSVGPCRSEKFLRWKS